LSDSRVTSASSTFTVSPAVTNTSMTGTSLKSPISGTFTSCIAPAFASEGEGEDDGGGAAAAAARGGAAAGLGEGVAAADGLALVACRAAPAPFVSSVRINPPSLTLSPTRSLRSFTTPADGDGTSIVALSDSSVTSASSGFTASPGFTNTSITGTSLKSPMSGTFTSCTAAPSPFCGAACGGGREGCAAGAAACGDGFAAGDDR